MEKWINIEVLNNLSGLDCTTKVYFKLLEFAYFQEVRGRWEIVITPERKEEILKICGISSASYHRVIHKLLKTNVITGKRGLYIPNLKMTNSGNPSIIFNRGKNYPLEYVPED